MSLTGLICNFMHTIMFLYACSCGLYLVKELVPQHFVTIEALRYKLWDSTLKPGCMAVIQVITDLFQDHYKDFLWVIEALDIKHFVPLSVSTIISPLFALGLKVSDLVVRLGSKCYQWITLEKFVYIYPVAFWIVSFVYAVLNRRWQVPDNEEDEGGADDDENDDKSGDESDDEDSEYNEEAEDDEANQAGYYDEDDIVREQQRIRRMRRGQGMRQEDRLRSKMPIPRINNVGPMNSRRLDDRLCSICCENERNAVLLPCGHTNLCLHCAYNYNDINKSCPFCQKSVETIHRIFL